jgi:acetylornithine/succinyldiaminopimelate/putrescine aminotransferase
MGDVLHEAISDLGAKEVRGLGLMQAFEFAEPRAKAFQQACLEAGLIVNAVDDHSVRLVPPLIIDSTQIERAHSTMRKAATAGGRPLSP